MNNCVVFINGIRHRFVEIEYYCNGYNHPDPFAHGDDMQKTTARWYFHKTGKNYRGGSFKGIDLTFGDDDCFGGILIRAVEMIEPPCTLVDGPSLTVDHILKTNKVDNIAEFVEKFGVSAEPKDGARLYVQYVGPNVIPRRDLHNSARVGLSLKKYKPEMEFYFARPYRYYSNPQKLKKGKHYMVVSMIHKKNTEAHTNTITKVSTANISAYKGYLKKGIEKGKGSAEDRLKEVKKYLGEELKTDDLIELLGLCSTFLFPGEALDA